jgi:hypothetical protein
VVGLPNNDWKLVKVQETTIVVELKDKVMECWGIITDKITLICLNTVMEDSYYLIDYFISKLGDVKVEINNESKGVEQSNNESDT